MNRVYFNNSGIPNEYKDFEIESSGTCTRAMAPDPTSSEIMDSIKKAHDLLFGGPKIIEVWKGDNTLLPRPKYPQIHKDELIDKDTFYLVAGVGVVAGKRAFSRLKELKYVPVWSDEPPERKEQ